MPEGQLDGVLSQVVPDLSVDMVLCHLTTINLLYTNVPEMFYLSCEILKSEIHTIKRYDELC